MSRYLGGIGVYPVDANIISLNQTGYYRITNKKFKLENKDVFLNLYNNIWGVNFRMWIGGSWSSGVRIWSFDKYNNESSLMTPSEEAKMPLIAGYAEGNGEIGFQQLDCQFLKKRNFHHSFREKPRWRRNDTELWEISGRTQMHHHLAGKFKF